MFGLGVPVSHAAASQPCDIYAAAGTPCVAAHSTTRALFASYNGSLYQVRRSSDNSTRDIGVLSPGGVADAAAQDSFCSGTTCLITVIYDQSGRGNHLTQAPPGGFRGPAPGGYDNLADATAAPTVLNGHKAYGVYVAPGTGYRNNRTSGVATGDNPEGMYAIFDGTHYNGGCCFDYGNAETDSRDDGNGTMEAIYFGNIRVWGYGTGNGPWVMADLENGLYSGVNAGYNANDPTVNHRYLTAIIKGGPNLWSIRAGNAQSGGLSTFYSGPRPNVAGYNPMRKQGAIILGTGGDNSIGSAGTFYEGVMTSGYPSDATENAVQASITAAGYGTGGTGGGYPSGYHRLTVANDGLCLDVYGATGASGAAIDQWTCNGQTNQQFQFLPGSGGYGELQAQNSGLVVAVANSSTTAGTPDIVQQTRNGAANTMWLPIQQSDGSYEFQNKNSGLCLDVYGAGGNLGQQLDQWPCKNAPGTNQDFAVG
ncbi:arabinofuranosidase catalytic domain-containing protein [Actinomadura fibrosa]|uniref:Arabinofuranosidase catalytic domain-containing protein n=1 Tax=Actinomadura fibrosa TaxID=111802 RepID=A0ABW2XF10_9ACTN|nr:arabinofuranosidase catalytic domain-containing protein [Actinomadura fibrosa]